MTTDSDFFRDVVAPHLTDDLRRPPFRGDPNPLAGHCYVASEALFHIIGGRDRGLKPMFIRHEGQPHWFLWDEWYETVIDVTACQFTTPVPYERAKGKGFLTKEPSQRTRVVLQRIKKAGGWWAAFVD